MTVPEIRIGFDPGSSLTKIIYSVNQNRPQVLVMEPEVLTLPIGSVTSSLTEFNGVSAAPENSAWVKLGRDVDQCHVVGFLAQEFRAFARLDQLKYEQALYKLLAVIGVIVQRERLPLKVDVRAIGLLPYGEIQNHKRLKAQLEKECKRFWFKEQPIKVNLVSFLSSPEGGGLAWSLIHQNGQDWFNAKTAVVLMFGHRNTSCLTFKRGIVDPRASQTTSLGFFQLLDKILQRSAGQEREGISEAVFQLKDNLSLQNPALRKLIRSTHAGNVEAEAKELLSAIQTAKAEYWWLLRGWLDSIVPNTLDALVIGGGASQYFKPELIDYLGWTQPIWSEIAPLPDSKIDDLLRYRMSDIWGLFKTCFVPDVELEAVG
jgi:hypothetical protein